MIMLGVPHVSRIPASDTTQQLITVYREGQHALQGSKGTSTDKLRLALVFLLTCESLPSDGDYERVTAALAASGADTSALAYVRRMRRLNLTGRSVRPHQTKNRIASR